jgi:putative Mn2+ efflux pump MntP
MSSIKQEVFEMNGKVAGIVAIVLAVAAGVGSVFYYVNHHSLRALVLLIGFVVLLVLGIVFIVRPSKKG